MENTTKERILDEALVAFAANGYKGTNLRALAAGMGLSKSALYKHYAGKEDIRNAVLDRMEACYSERFGASENIPQAPKSCGELYTMTMQMPDFTMHGQKVTLTRRLLLMEQFHDERARHFATRYFLNNTKEIYTHIFAEMMENGILKKDAPEILAFAYTSPISVLIRLCGREPEKEPEIMQQIEAFIKQFIKTYAQPRKCCE